MLDFDTGSMYGIFRENRIWYYPDITPLFSFTAAFGTGTTAHSSNGQDPGKISGEQRSWATRAMTANSCWRFKKQAGALA
jgi:hypothetical protein